MYNVVVWTGTYNTTFQCIPFRTKQWYQLVHTTSWSALCAWTLNFSLSVMVLPWHTSRTAESPSHSYFSFLPSSLSIVSLSHSSPLPLWLFTSPVSPYSSPPVYCLCSLSLFLFVSIPIPPPTLSLHYLLSPDGLLFQLHCSSQIILFNTPSFYLKQTIHFLIRCFFTHTRSSPTLW